MTTIEQVAEILQKSQKVALFAHTNPDGDAIGSSIALCAALRDMGKICEIFCDSALSKKLLSFSIPSIEIHKDFFGKYDLFVAVDCGDIFRLGEFAGIYNGFTNTLTIDHHFTTNYYSKYNYVINASATAEIVFDILNLLKCPITTDIATQLFIGISTDTGNFSHPNTTSKCFLVASELAKHSIPIAPINRVYYKSKSLALIRLIGRVTTRMRSYFDDRFCLIYITQQDLKDFGLGNDAATDIVNYGINVETAIVAASIFEYKANTYKISMRGKDFVIRDICEFYGGGGHNFAAGCQISGFFEDVVDKLVKSVGDKLL